LNGDARLKEPMACTESERREFARLVREGFEGSDEGLDGRIRDASCLAFHYAAGGTLAAIAGLKAPREGYRDDLFKKAEAEVNAGDYKLELGWVFVVPAYRERGIGEGLCRTLLARVPGVCVFATTRPNNVLMIKILDALGFVRVGRPYPRRGEELVLFLRPAEAKVAGV
jgi:ribosomal protein S18 acetylase RimI-like enzyme